MKKVAIILSVILLILAIPATIFLAGQSQELRKKATPATTLAFSPASVTKKPGETFSLDITLDTGENQVVAAELHVIFDPAKLEAQSITNSALFPNILASGMVERGSSSISVGAPNVKKPYKGTGSIAVIRFKALENTDIPVSVRLAQNTFVGAIGEGATNVLIGSTPATITISDGNAPAPKDPVVGTNQAQNQPSPTLFVTPSLTPTGMPIATPTIAATMSATLTISAPALNSAATIATPTIRGKAAPGATVTITIYSTPQTVTVKADANGNWSYTPITPLESGNHNVVASASDATGNTQTATTAFVVAAGGGQVATESATIVPTPQPIPVSGNTSMTVLFGLIGMVLILGGVVFAAMTL